MPPAPEADRRTLARRVQPRPDRPAARAGSWSRRSSTTQRRTPTSSSSIKLLASPHWGEHRGRYWLDAARYADTHGIHFDNFREMWSYRDWVINAFNAEHAVRPVHDRASWPATCCRTRRSTSEIASGFNRCNITTNEGGAIAEEYLVLYTRDRTETTSQVWLGLTAGCAVCHDHKFDPLTQNEFYELSAFFNNTTQARDGRQHQGHAADRDRAARPKTGRAGTKSTNEIAAPQASRSTTRRKSGASRLRHVARNGQARRRRDQGSDVGSRPSRCRSTMATAKVRYDRSHGNKRPRRAADEPSNGEPGRAAAKAA